jgi:mannose-6-phosphate isomerase-like protein (cupin superfamily)
VIYMVKLIKNYNNNVPNWDSLIENFNNSVINKKMIKHRCLGFFVSHEAYQIKEVEKVLKELKLNTAHLYFNITLNGSGFGKHIDDVDVYFWQVKGQCEWIVEDRKYLLNVGDLIIVPKLIEHEVIPLTPRAGISMSL